MLNDGFGVSHRAHASVEGLRIFCLQQQAFTGKEIRFVGQAVENPLHPFVAIIGGAKVSDKIGVIEIFWKSRYPADRRRYGQYFFSCSRA